MGDVRDSAAVLEVTNPNLGQPGQPQMKPISVTQNHSPNEQDNVKKLDMSHLECIIHVHVCE